MKIIRAKDGSARREVDLADIKIPDLWYTAMVLKGFSPEPRDKVAKHQMAEKVLECWYLCHDLLEHLYDLQNLKAAAQPAQSEWTTEEILAREG